jgi:hypothetical protein
MHCYSTDVRVCRSLFSSETYGSANTARAVPLGACHRSLARSSCPACGANIRRVDAGQLKSDWRSSDAEKVNVGRFQIPTHVRHTRR